MSDDENKYGGMNIVLWFSICQIRPKKYIKLGLKLFDFHVLVEFRCFEHALLMFV